MGSGCNPHGLVVNGNSSPHKAAKCLQTAAQRLCETDMQVMAIKAPMAHVGVLFKQRASVVRSRCASAASTSSSSSGTS